MDMKGILTRQETLLREPVRNHFFYGKLMDVYHFELETAYFITMRQLLNRLISGCGVVCGLDVRKPDPDRNEIVITPGVAVDRWGREIIVAQETAPNPIPDELLPEITEAEPDQPEQDEVFVHVVLCYHECESDPAPVLASDCQSAVVCAPGSIRERYKVDFGQGKASRPTSAAERCFPKIISSGSFDYGRFYEELAEWVTTDRGCPSCPGDPCIPLANICLHHEQGGYRLADIDITIRPIVYSNDLLFDLLTSLLAENRQYGHGK
jgi:hypothetical protein